MRTVPVQQAVFPGQIFVQHEVFAKQPDGLGRAVAQFRHGGDRLPVAAQQGAHRLVRSHLGQKSVASVAEHGFRFFPAVDRR